MKNLCFFTLIAMVISATGCIPLQSKHAVGTSPPDKTQEPDPAELRHDVDPVLQVKFIISYGEWPRNMTRREVQQHVRSQYLAAKDKCFAAPDAMFDTEVHNTSFSDKLAKALVYQTNLEYNGMPGELCKLHIRNMWIGVHKNSMVVTRSPVGDFGILWRDQELKSWVYAYGHEIRDVNRPLRLWNFYLAELQKEYDNFQARVVSTYPEESVAQILEGWRAEQNAERDRLYDTMHVALRRQIPKP